MICTVVHGRRQPFKFLNFSWRRERKEKKKKKKKKKKKNKKKGKEGKEQLVKKLQNYINIYNTIYVFYPLNMRSDKMKSIRNRFKQSSSIVFGKNKVMQHAFGNTDLKPNLNLLTEFIRGQCGVMFTNESREVVEEFFRNYREIEYPRAGFVAVKEVVVPKGPLENFSHAVEPYLRKLGLPTQLKNGVIHVLADYVICKEGQQLNPEQCKLLEYFGEKMAEFKIVLKCSWHNDEFLNFDENC